MHRRAFTLIELLVVILVSVIIIAVLLPARGRSGSPRPLKDSTQVRGIVQSMIVWASNNQGRYPLPSEIDTENATVPEIGRGKDTTANILSLMIFDGHISPEICIGPAESNTAQIQRCDNYEYNTPTGAASPAKALWDPAFRGTPEDAPTYANLPQSGIGHQSYAHAIPFGKRRAAWSDTFNSTEAVFGNRGPTYAKDDAAPSSAKWTLTPDKFGSGSNTLLIHGGRYTWEGNIGYNDGHVNFEIKPAPDALTLMIPGKWGKAVAPDNLFVNETDEADGDGTTGRIDKGVNAYLRPIAEVQSSARPRFWRD